LRRRWVSPECTNESPTWRTVVFFAGGAARTAAGAEAGAGASEVAGVEEAGVEEAGVEEAGVGASEAFVVGLVSVASAFANAGVGPSAGAPPQPAPSERTRTMAQREELFTVAFSDNGARAARFRPSDLRSMEAFPTCDGPLLVL